MNKSKENSRMKKARNKEQYICNECGNMFFHPEIYEMISSDERCPYCGSERITKEKELLLNFS